MASAGAIMNDLWLLSHLLLWIGVVGEGILIVVLMRQVGSLILRVGSVTALDAGVGPAVGDPAPWIPDVAESEVDHRELTLITFVSTSCGACDELVPALNAVHRDYADRAAVVVVAQEADTQVQQWKRGQHLRTPTISSDDAFAKYSVRGTPYAFVLDSDNRVAARGGVNHIEHLEALLRECGLGRHRQSPTLEEGEVDAHRPV